MNEWLFYFVRRDAPDVSAQMTIREAPLNKLAFETASAPRKPAVANDGIELTQPLVQLVDLIGSLGAGYPSHRDVFSSRVLSEFVKNGPRNLQVCEPQIESVDARKSDLPKKSFLLRLPKGVHIDQLPIQWTELAPEKRIPC